jgi:regulator of RNase E activity RraB
MANWQFYVAAEASGSMRSTAVDMSVVSSAPQISKPIVFWVQVGMRHPNRNGLASREEASVLREIESKAIAEVTSQMDAVYVAQLNRDGRFEMYFYVPNTNGADKIATGLVAHFAGYEIKTGSKNDPDWSAYLTEFYPQHPKSKQQIFNFSLIETLKQNGDPLTSVHLIDHTVRFPTPDLRQKFSDLATAQNFTESQKFEEAGLPDRRYGITVSHEFMINLPTINKVTWLFIDLAEQCGGQYDGWGTSAKLPKK